MARMEPEISYPCDPRNPRHKFGLEVQLPRNLDNSRTARLACCAIEGERTEPLKIRRTCRIQERARCRTELRRSVQRGPVRVIEHVIRFQAKLNVTRIFLAVFDLPEQRHIPVVQPWAAYAVDT